MSSMGGVWIFSGKAHLLREFKSAQAEEEKFIKNPPKGCEGQELGYGNLLEATLKLQL